MSDKEIEVDALINIRAKAANYARIFLVQKYHEEYTELYRAYLINRGVTARKRKPLKDERIINV